MATEQHTLPVNGNYAPQGQPYGSEYHAQAAGPASGSFAPQGASGPSTTDSAASGSNGSASATGAIPKDEVGWYFVEQYYTTLSRSPEKLHLFYSKRSQFVSGQEAEKVAVCVGQKAINERIKELDIQDCKVRVSNVDSQASFQNIVVQVIGEMSNKSQPHRKFVQTFVLAEQPNGYFVLNDIFRYINDEEEELETEEAPVDNAVQTEAVQQAAPTEPEHRTLSNSPDPKVREQDAAIIDKELEEEVAKEPEPAPTASATNGAEVAPATEDATGAPAATKEAKDALTPDAADSAAAAESAQPEKPKDPEPTPTAASPKAAPAQAAPAPAPAAAPAAPKPTAPKTWANLVAAHKVATPVTPVPAASTSPGPAQPRAAPAPAPAAAPAPAPAQAQAQAQPTAPRDASPASGQASPGAGWQTAGNDNKRHSRPQPTAGAGEKENVMAYVKGVTDKVEEAALKSTLEKFGELAYFDISRQRNCAFVEFATPAGFNAAVSANPHTVGGEQILVEERRIRAGYGGYGPGRGGLNRGRGGSDGRPQGRGGFPRDGGRGGYAPRGRGGNVAPKARGGSQAA
ncbi:hypothetical protein L228DRAFT_62167 [Xylona heveae TC161]|uniref:NTF2-domain-containing protein n=1 Tax=Xylona heveae (strain CBS 132557 / TC161) TaxID=1328760 RepID=A0A165IMJ0_XYLHT|nr:hypothetical protein L228DRAFT_62167 [Xylona heveae TC161]KZF25110.1 hypothetical protein L228DRAFT_62167 [Xylona heveae TC161]